MSVLVEQRKKMLNTDTRNLYGVRNRGEGLISSNYRMNEQNETDRTSAPGASSAKKLAQPSARRILPFYPPH